jgi:hypothetical protein
MKKMTVTQVGCLKRRVQEKLEILSYPNYWRPIQSVPIAEMPILTGLLSIWVL